MRSHHPSAAMLQLSNARQGRSSQAHLSVSWHLCSCRNHRLQAGTPSKLTGCCTCNHHSCSSSICSSMPHKQNQQQPLSSSKMPATQWAPARWTAWHQPQDHQLCQPHKRRSTASATKTPSAAKPANKSAASLTSSSSSMWSQPRIKSPSSLLSVGSVMATRWQLQ